MGFALKLIILVTGFALGVGLLKYNFQLTQLFGHNSLAERYLGDGGTYTMWKLLGTALIIITVIYVF